MRRIRIPIGILHAHQLRTIAEKSPRNTRMAVCADIITVRQIPPALDQPIRIAPDIFERLWKVASTIFGACVR